jgi:Pyruvate phosphate dikinase, AMP/ATP-binding domain
MILGDISGVVFSKNAVTNNSDEILLETVPGGNELLTDGLVRPLKFIIDKSRLTIKVFPEENIWKDLISDETVIEIAKSTIDIEKFFSKAQDIEWTVANNTLFILQARPITVFNSNIVAPNYLKPQKNQNDIISIYRSYRIPENLQRHMLEVSAVAKWILANRNEKNKLNERDILTTLLLHDIGNIVKGLDESFANLFPEGYKYMPYWKAVQQWIKGRYGESDTIATINMAKEIGVSDRVLFLLENKQFLNNEFTYNSEDMALKICAYSDQRVSPYGILPIRQRLREAVNRYKGAQKKISVNDPNRDRLIDIAEKIEEQIFAGMKKKPSEVNPSQYMKDLRSFSLQEKN